MCKGLFGGGSKTTQAVAAPAAVAPPSRQTYDTGAEVKDTDVIASGSGEASGRVKLGKGSKKNTSVAVGLSI